MNKSSNSRSSMFLMEVIIAILFFSVVSGICLKMFTKSHLISTDTKNLNMAVSQAGSVAEAVKSSSDGQKHLKLLFPEAVLEQSQATLYYDSNWKPCSASESAFYLLVTSRQPDDNTSLTDYNISVEDTEGNEIYTLNLSIHEPLHS